MAGFLARLSVPNLNSEGLVKVGLDGGILRAGSLFLASLVLMASTPWVFLRYCWPWFNFALYLFMTSGVLGMAADGLVWYLLT